MPLHIIEKNKNVNIFCAYGLHISLQGASHFSPGLHISPLWLHISPLGLHISPQGASQFLPWDLYISLLGASHFFPTVLHISLWGRNLKFLLGVEMWSPFLKKYLHFYFSPFICSGPPLLLTAVDSLVWRQIVVNTFINTTIPMVRWS